MHLIKFVETIYNHDILWGKLREQGTMEKTRIIPARKKKVFLLISSINFNKWITFLKVNDISQKRNEHNIESINSKMLGIDKDWMKTIK